ncbi:MULTISPECIES: hypothetical protein [Microbacterium]|uniref:hypothetical protein n=1 Tax=Microbacterium TaxID=33882 RepID=UPI0013A58624|nr:MULTISPECIES: hypothetical protein [Microbacterium]
MDESVSGWWRANALAVGAIALLVPALIVTISWNERSGVDANRGDHPITLDAGASTSYAGATVGPAAAEFTDLPLAPQDSRVVTVTIRIEPGSPAFGCTAPLLRETTGAQRQWNATDDLGREWDPEVHTFCDPDDTTPYELELDYLVPADASGPFAVELVSATGLPEFVRAVVEP